MIDREQIRRDAEAWIAIEGVRPRSELPHETSFRLARHCLALLAELEQAERERNDADGHLNAEYRLHRTTESRLAKVPALVEAADSLCLAIERTVIRQSGAAIRALEEVQAALAAWEDAPRG